MKFSVIIPAYNVIDYVCEAIESVQNQTWQEFEIIVVDDNSTDGTYGAVLSLSSMDSRIKILKNEGKGVSDARNYGIDNATGDYILFLDADDFYTSRNLFESLNRVIEETAADVIHFGYSESSSRHIDSKDAGCELYDYKTIDAAKVIERTVYMLPHEFYDRSLRAASPWAKTYRIEFLRNHGIKFPSKVKNSEDAIFNLRVLQHKPTCRILDLIAYHYWQRPNNSGNRFMPEFSDDFYSTVQMFEHETEPFLELPGISERVYLRLFSYVDKVLRQHLCHKDYEANNPEELRRFISDPVVQRIVSGCSTRMISKQYWLILWSIMLKSPMLLRLSFKMVIAVKSILRR